MKVHEFLEHHGIAGNPFAEEDAQNDTVFKRTCLETTFHPAWDKVYGDPSDPSTAIVFGEKGSGKTALKLQMVRQFERHNEAHPDARKVVVLYDDFNPFLDRFVSRVGRGRPVEKTRGQWKLWAHMDAILTLSVTQLVTRLVADGDKLPRLTRPQARDLALLAACYDQSTAESFPTRWSRLRRRVGYRTWLGNWPRLAAAASTLAFVAAAVVGATRGDVSWLGQWWPWAALVAGWVPFAWRWLRSVWRAWRSCG
ncbi:MAG: hypothetical protein ACKON8_07905, partial [Planctomycetota bacterium]